MKELGFSDVPAQLGLKVTALAWFSIRLSESSGQAKAISDGWLHQEECEVFGFGCWQLGALALRTLALD